MDSSNPVTPFLYNCVLCFFSVWQGLLHGKMLEKKQKNSIFCTVFGIRLFCPSPAPGALLTGGILKVFSEHPTPRFGIQFTSMVLKSGQTIFFKYFFPTHARALARLALAHAPRPSPQAQGQAQAHTQNWAQAQGPAAASIFFTNSYFWNSASYGVHRSHADF